CYGANAGKTSVDPVDDRGSKYFAKTVHPPKGFLSPWRRQFKQTDAPGYVWVDPDVPTRFVLVCVHGLGLHHKSYESFAKRVAKEGVITVAFDVRGFGTFVDASGLEKVSMHECVQDLKQVTSVLRKDYAKFPLFLLGESMGGAIALRVVSESPEIVDGLICSVPSGARHKSLGTALKVGTELFFDKTKPMAVGNSVVKQATGSSELQHQWLNDPASRLNLSAQELLEFNKFMGENLVAAKKISSKPVILFQGHDDKLVKESGTLELFDTLATPRKSIVILGNTEHLIFEAGQFKDDLTLGVIGWMSGLTETKE
ncbi:MAG: alpha/beta fold hydrolase, partial [Cyanobacteria bacterium SZAS-4]|nr:alpha/beta fold hydrolase [Cyanobacteria bacterium SZAS-4]